MHARANTSLNEITLTQLTYFLILLKFYQNKKTLQKCLEQSTQAHKSLRLVVIAIGINDREAGASVGMTTLLHDIKHWGILKGIDIKFALIPFSHDLSRL